ncbi:FRG domain-containing protein [Pseudoalteromonas sp. MEBiC 03607]|uniref:FRG domain-containing protein n=1 Tax=Pseudoalteromonas sp. MEBiC 03607 TaxID=2563601 RepID=UPI001093EA9F|nr:FRG domain-containing protein [Pseudoalteromonas sp. MEBiC 03607]TGV20143.1 FRG domain-containing protein [Pseudoalteromonas sp. MEBiC 03607]
MNEQFWGQWIGEIKGTNDGLVQLNIDSDRLDRGFLTVYEYGSDRASFSCDLLLTKTENTLSGKAFNVIPNLLPGDTLSAEQAQSLMPTEINVSAEIDEAGNLTARWDTDVETIGSGTLYNAEQCEASDAHATITWNQFKEIALQSKHANDEMIFRGQHDSSFALKTYFHRQGRRNLQRYAKEDLPVLHRHIAATINRKFDFASSEEHTELIFLAQHHGYPTPLLDWSNSPFVAAYFAFQSVPKGDASGASRIFMFDSREWELSGPERAIALEDPRPSFCLFNLVTRGNPRVLPQQSLVTFSNVYSIERFIRFYENRNNKRYLTVFDIPHSERATVMKDLEIMGITASTLFPGVDGVCKSLTEMYF